MKNNDKFIQEFEMELLWGSGCDRETLSKNTGIGIRTIQKYINDYIQSANGTISYNKKLNAYIANNAFEPTLINDDPEFYLQYCLGEQLQKSILQKNNVTSSPRFPIEDIQSLTTSNVDDQIMDKLVQAINTQSQICGTYVAKKGSRSDIILSPHSIALARNRYHVRAYHYKFDCYSDFVVGRFESIRIHSEPQEGVSADNDTEWQTFDELVFEFNSELTHEEIDSFRMEWNLPAKSNQKIIRTRRALAKYVRQEMEKTTIGTAHQTWIYKEDK